MTSSSMYIISLHDIVTRFARVAGAGDMQPTVSM